ncbi:MAG TPA: metalloregulator ArsR/SmtB family transcription factor [Nannocystis sp.]
MPRRRSPAAALTEAARVFAALGEPTRLRLVARLCDAGPLSIAELTAGTGVSRQAVTKHLVVLEKAGIVRSERDGRARIWELQPRRVAEARRHLDRIATRWEAAPARSRGPVEAT